MAAVRQIGSRLFYGGFMDKFNFISTAINQLFVNPGLHEYLIYILGVFGLIICYKSVTMWIKK